MPDNDSPDEQPARRGFSISYRGRTLLSRIDPVAQGERLAAEIPVKERTLYFCPSPLYGYGLSQFLARLRDELPQNDSALLCAETDESLFKISRNSLGELAGKNGCLALIRTSDPETLCAFVRKTWGERVFRRVEVVHITGGWQLFPQLYEDFARALTREIELEWGNAMTMIRLGRLYARNLIRNLALFPECENIGALNFGSSPVLALGAGPSLDSLLDDFSARFGGSFPGPDKRPFKIICADTCIPALHDRSILPDLVVILESQHWNLRDFIGERGRKIDAALDLSALPASVTALGGGKYFFFTPWAELKFLTRLKEAELLPAAFAPLGSVGLSAVALSLHITSGPVLLGGLDFSYTLDSYHARSTPGQRDLHRRQNRFRSVINAGATLQKGSFSAIAKNGKTVRSDPAMRNYSALFKEEFGGKGRLLDVTGTGLPLGIKTVSTASAFAVLTGVTDAAPSLSPHGGKKHISKKDLTKTRRVAEFIRKEITTLVVLRETLTGERPPVCLDELLDASDYLWAHFPECAGTCGRRPPATDIGFLKRVRAEIEPFLKLWEMALAELERKIT